MTSSTDKLLKCIDFFLSDDLDVSTVKMNRKHETVDTFDTYTAEFHEAVHLVDVIRFFTDEYTFKMTIDSSIMLHYEVPTIVFKAVITPRDEKKSILNGEGFLYGSESEIESKISDMYIKLIKLGLA